MTANIKTYLLPVLALFSVFCGCRKAQPSVVGAWTLSKWRFTVDSVGVRIIDVDTTYVPNNSTNTIAVYGNGTFVMTRRPNPRPFVGRYSLVRNTIVFKDTATTGTVVTDTIASLTDGQLTLSQKSSTRRINAQDSLDTRVFTYHNTFSFIR